MAIGEAGEAKDPAGVRVVVPAELWRNKVLRDHPELALHFADVLRAVAEPDCVLPDPVYERRKRHYLRGAGPSRWLLVVVSYEQEPARLSLRSAIERIRAHGASRHQNRPGRLRPRRLRR